MPDYMNMVWHYAKAIDYCPCYYREN